MGCTTSKPAAKVPMPLRGNNPGPPAEVGYSADPSEAGGSASSAWFGGLFKSKASKYMKGHHWAENDAGEERRIANVPWKPSESPGGAKGASQGGSIPKEVCQPCESSGASAATIGPTDFTIGPTDFEFKCTFPMMVMNMSTFMGLKRMASYEDMIKDKLVFEWKPDMGKVFFLSHQWTSFDHPDPEGEQLEVVQGFLAKVGEGKIKSLFATKEEWLAFHYKETSSMFKFEEVTEEDTEEEMASDVNGGYVWLDYASVPQAMDEAAEEQRLRAIDSIPFYVDHSTCFLAIVPTVEHKDLKGTYCTYNSWRERGWCRLETQVHELRLFKDAEGEMFPGVPRLNLPRRPLIVHSATYATTYDFMDNFYMNWQRKNSVFTGEFACCRLGHKRTKTAGEIATVTCDKTRIRPLVRALFERKNAHMARMHPFVKNLFRWRYVSHMDIMMSDYSEDTAHSNDPDVNSLDDMVRKYQYGEMDLLLFFSGFLPMLRLMIISSPSVNEPDDSPVAGGGGAAILTQANAWVDKWAKACETLEGFQVAHMTSMAVAEGNLGMLEKLHKEHNADLTLGFPWGITLLDFAAGKGHTRIIDYLFRQNLAMDVIDKPSFRERITAIDRACKSGFVEVVDMLVERGVKLSPMRLNRQVPAHGAAIMGHTHVLRRLHELGADLVHAYDVKGKSPLDYAKYYCHKEATEFLRSLHTSEDGLTRYERTESCGSAGCGSAGSP